MFSYYSKLFKTLERLTLLGDFMYKYLLALTLSLFCVSANAQDIIYTYTNPGYYNPPPSVVYGYTPYVTYVPVVQWRPAGTWLNAGPIVVSPDRRYVRFGINVGFSDYYGVNTFNFYNGQTNFYPAIR